MNLEQDFGDESAMAKADLYKMCKYSLKLFKMLEPHQELEAWVQAKITKAADYIASVYHYMEYELKISEYGEQLENSDMYSESVKRAYKQKLMEARRRLDKSKDQLSEEDQLNETVYDAVRHPKYGKINWINYGGAHMIAKKNPDGSLHIYKIGNHEDIHRQWMEIKHQAENPVQEEKASWEKEGDWSKQMKKQERAARKPRPKKEDKPVKESRKTK